MSNENQNSEQQDIPMDKYSKDDMYNIANYFYGSDWPLPISDFENYLAQSPKEEKE